MFPYHLTVPGVFEPASRHPSDADELGGESRNEVQIRQPAFEEIE
jgi:hypothetical protein